MKLEAELMNGSDDERVLADHERFWESRDLRSIHVSVLRDEFGETCFVVRGDAGILGYLIRFVTPAGTGARSDGVRSDGV